MNSTTWHVEKIVPLLFTAGFFAHLINIAREFAYGSSTIKEILLWPVDFVLALIMIYCGIALVARRKEFFTAFDMNALPRRIGYWVITVYIIASIPGHLLFLVFGNTVYFDIFPWWFSVVLLLPYVVMIGYFITLRPTGLGRPSIAMKAS
jgi:hypothetical protein